MSSMNILFVFPNMYNAPCWSPAIQILSAVMKEKGHAVSLMHILEGEFDAEKIAEKVISKDPDLICMTATSFEYDAVEKLAGEIKERAPEKLQVLGGISATLRPEMIDSSNFDMFCVGEGEKPLCELVDRLSEGKDFKDIGSLHFKDKKNPIQPFVQDLNDLPFYDWEIMNTQSLIDNRAGWLSIGFSRGCPYNCTFCVNQALRKIKGNKNYVRRRSPDNAIAELKYLVDKYEGIKVFNLDDDLLVADKKWISSFCGMYKSDIYEKHNIEFKIEARIDTVNEDVIKLLKESGCREIQLGVESGNEYIRNEVIKKNISNEQIEKIFELCEKHGLRTFSFMMLGVPGESKESLQDTQDLLLKIKPYLVRPTFYTPIYETPLYEECVKRNMFRDVEFNDHFTDSPLKFEGKLTNDYLLKFAIFLPWNINVRLGYEQYREWIEHYSGLEPDELKNKFDDILEKDEELHSSVEGIHYKYFNKNIYYLQRVDDQDLEKI